MWWFCVPPPLSVLVLQVMCVAGFSFSAADEAHLLPTQQPLHKSLNTTPLLCQIIPSSLVVALHVFCEPSLLLFFGFSTSGFIYPDIPCALLLAYVESYVQWSSSMCSALLLLCGFHQPASTACNLLLPFLSNKHLCLSSPAFQSLLWGPK